MIYNHSCTASVLWLTKLHSSITLIGTVWFPWHWLPNIGSFIYFQCKFSILKLQFREPLMIQPVFVPCVLFFGSREPYTDVMVWKPAHDLCCMLNALFPRPYPPSGHFLLSPVGDIHIIAVSRKTSYIAYFRFFVLLDHTKASQKKHQKSRYAYFWACWSAILRFLHLNPET